MQDGDNPVESGAAPSSAPSNASKSGFKLDFSPETMQLKQKAATLASMGHPELASAPEPTPAPVAEPEVVVPAEEMSAAEPEAPVATPTTETTEFSSDPELAAAQAEFAAEPQPSGEVDMEQMMAADGAAHVAEAISGENLPEETLVDEAAPAENPFADAPTDVITAPKGKTANTAPQKHGLNPKIIAFICIIGILVVSIVVVIVLHLVSSATPVVEETIEEIEETVQETSKGKERKVVKKPTDDTQEEEQPTEEQPVEETPAPAEEPEVDENILQIDIPEANTRIKIPLDGNFITYRKVGNKITFWAATKREGATNAVSAEAQENCVDDANPDGEQTNCGSDDADVPEFADKYVNTKGMASLTWWKAANPDTGETVFESEPWYIVYSTGMQSSFSTDEAEGAWESESTMYLYDLLTNPQIYEKISTE